ISPTENESTFGDLLTWMIDHIIWTFGAENPNMLLATIKKREVKSDYDESFRDRLQLNSQTGALTITQLSVLDSGIYKWQAISDTISWKQFNLTVYGSYICSLSSSFNTKSCSSVTVECSVHNSQDLVLSWYRVEERLTNISSPDLSSKLYLALEIESHERGSYSCIAENPVEKKMTKLSGEDTTMKIDHVFMSVLLLVLVSSPCLCACLIFPVLLCQSRVTCSVFSVLLPPRLVNCDYSQLYSPPVSHSLDIPLCI
uniref:Ig-like domain-containing protein n=1 Tax=Oreochromis aureus TaxID=47969 RepID=A0A668UWR6_OREAU